jgi:hypothetical protein
LQRQREILPAWKIHHPENGNVGPEEHMEDPDGLQALPQLHVTLKRPLRYLWKVKRRTINPVFLEEKDVRKMLAGCMQEPQELSP